MSVIISDTVGAVRERITDDANIRTAGATVFVGGVEDLEHVRALDGEQLADRRLDLNRGMSDSKVLAFDLRAE
jgi:hypothetical protein